jgi:polysaccharide chain length determinant protein (PEP-CTERM system associated)
LIPGTQYTPELIAQIAWRRKWWILLPAIAIAAGVVQWTRSLTDLYRSDAVILVVPQQVPESYVRSTVTASVADRLQSISQQILSRTRLERIVLDLNLYPEERKTGIMEDIVDNMRSQIDVATVRGESFRVGFISNDPRTAMRVAERLASLFIDESLRDREVLAEGTSQFLEAQLEDSRRQLIDNEKQLENYRRTHAGQLPTELNANMQGLHNTEMQIQAVVDSLNRNRDRQVTLQQAITDLEANALVQPETPAAAAAQPAADAYHKADAELQQMQNHLKPTHPDVIRAKKRLEELKAAADAEAAQVPVAADEILTPAERLRRTRLNAAVKELENVENEIASSTANEKRLRDILGEYQKRIEATPTRESELIELTRDYGTLQGMYTSLLSKKQESQISANLERRQIGEQFRILDPARLPARPFTPNRPRYYQMGILGGLGFGLALAGLLEYLDKTMRSEDDVRVALNYPVLATIPLIQFRSRTRRVMVAAVSFASVALLGAVAFVAFRYLR